jgi:oligosaccharide repeat unit polymerase
MLIDLLIAGTWAAGIYLSRRIFSDMFTPLCVYVSTWCACLLLYRMRLVEYSVLEPKTWLLIAGGGASFCLGCVLSQARSNKSTSLQKRIIVSLPWLRLAILVLLVLDLVGFAFFTERMSDTYGLGTYFTDPSIIRADAQEWTRAGAIGALILLCYPLLACSVIYILESRKLSWLSAVGLIVPVAETYLLTDRLNLVTFGTCSFFIWIYHSKRRTLDRRVLCSLGGGLICFLAYFLSVGALYGKLATPASSSFQFSILSRDSRLGLRMLDPYVYATASVPTFQAAMRDVDSLSWGKQTFYPLARILYAVGILERRPEASDFTFYFVPIPFNTYTWLYFFYCDFGICGVLFLPGLIGFLETALYRRMRAAPTIFSLAGSSALAASTAFTVFGYIQYDFILWIFLIVMFFVSRRTCTEWKGYRRSTAWNELRSPSAVPPAWT